VEVLPVKIFYGGATIPVRIFIKLAVEKISPKVLLKVRRTLRR
jgi:hypothetical protein